MQGVGQFVGLLTNVAFQDLHDGVVPVCRQNIWLYNQAHMILTWNLSVQNSDVAIAVFSNVSYKIHVTLLEVRHHLLVPG